MLFEFCIASTCIFATILFLKSKSRHIIKLRFLQSSSSGSKRKYFSNLPLLDSNSCEVDEDTAKFDATWGIILNDLQTETKFDGINSSVDWLKEVLERNVPFGKRTRAYLAIEMYQAINQNRTEEEDFLNFVTGWIIEIFQASALMADDVMDHSETRRGTLCWYKQPNVGLSALNDAFLLENFAHYLLFKYFAGKPYLLRLLNRINDNNMRTILGESLDLKLAKQQEADSNAAGGSTIDFSCFNMETYKSLVKFKTSFYTFHAPVVVAMEMSYITDPSLYVAVEDITLRIGELFQIQDDFLDAYGDPECTGKIGTDIKDGKLTWLLLQVLEMCSEEQQVVLQENYGQGINNSEAEAKVKAVYDELRLPELFYAYEEEQKNIIYTLVYSLPDAIPRKPLLNTIDMIYRRER